MRTAFSRNSTTLLAVSHTTYVEILHFFLNLLASHLVYLNYSPLRWKYLQDRHKHTDGFFLKKLRTLLQWFSTYGSPPKNFGFFQVRGKREALPKCGSVGHKVGRGML